ncbi:MAG: DUF1249 domain-containing protein [Candidatus Pseudothioglobus sp.]
MIIEKAQSKLIYYQEKFSYSNIYDLFELNFKKIFILVPFLPSIKNNCIAVKSSLNKLYLICHDKSPYTATYTLTHKTETQEKIIYRPDIRFKIYFDAKLLELISICKDTRINNSHPLLDNCSDLAFQFELNLFMLSWLDYCLDRYNGAEWKQKN